VVCAECLQLVQITTTLHRFSFENLECYKPQDLIMLISFANTGLIMAIASWKTSFRSYSFICIVRSYLLWIFQLAAASHHTSDYVFIIGSRSCGNSRSVCVCVCVHLSAVEFHNLYISGNPYSTHCGLGILWTATLLLSCKNILHARIWHGHNNHTSNIGGKLGATNSLGQNWVTQLPSLLNFTVLHSLDFSFVFSAPLGFFLPEETCF